MNILGDNKFFADLRDRRFAQFFAVYCGLAWLMLQAVDQLASREIVPELVYRVALTLAISGLPGALIVTWFHGEKGHQKMPAVEKWLLAGVAVLAMTASGLVIRAGLEPAQADARASAVAPWADPTRVAVLYFDTRGTGEDASFISAGLTEGLIDELSAVDALHVVSRNGSEMFRGSAATPDSIGRTLRVGTLVEGRVAVTGERIRLNVSLVESSSGRQLANTQIERPWADLFDLQDELAAQVSEFLRERIGHEVTRLEARRGTRVLEAWEHSRQAAERADLARDLAAAGDRRGAAEHLATADSMLAVAERLDPSWAHPPNRRGWLAYERARLWGFDREPQAELTERGLAHAERALGLEPRNADALELRATLLYWRYLLNLGDSSSEAQDLVQQAERGFRDAVAANPLQASALASLSHLLLNRGDLAQAKIMAARSYEADPFLRNANTTLWRLASTSWNLADAIETRRWCAEGRRRFPDDHRFRQCQLMLASLTGNRENLDAAWGQLREFVALSPPEVRDLNEKKGQMLVAMALARAELPDSARAVAARARAGPDIDPLREVAWMEAIVRTWVGDYDDAVRWLGIHLAADPGALETYRTAAERGGIHWTLERLVDEPAFRDLVGLR